MAGQDTGARGGGEKGRGEDRGGKGRRSDWDRIRRREEDRMRWQGAWIEREYLSVIHCASVFALSQIFTCTEFVHRSISHQPRRMSNGRHGMSVCSAFLDDIRNLRANAVLIIGVLTFAVLVWYHSEKLFGDAPPSTTRSKLKLSGGFANIKNEVLDIEKAMTDILANHKGVSQAAELAKMAVREQYELRTKYRAAAIFVFKQQGTNLHLAMRNAAKRNFIKEIVLLHDMSKPVDSFGNPVKEWLKCPKEIYGKPVNYVKSTQPLDELHKFYACASYTKDARTNVCFYQ
eukprot:767105-Hanusia_phi.AAC.2